MSGKSKKQVLVFVHDAGGAEIIGRYIQSSLRSARVHSYGAGPAKKLFRGMHLSLRTLPNTRAAVRAAVLRHRSADVALIAAPGWMSDFERNAIVEAKRAGLFTAVYLDAWPDIKRRFGYPARNWRDHLPRELWAGDRYAFKSAQTKLPQVRVRLVRNRSFTDALSRYRRLKRAAARPASILFVSQDGRESDRVLANVLKAMQRVRSPRTLRIRLHPADARNRYDGLLQGYKTVRTVRSEELDIVADLVRARVVIGAETAAMAISSICRIPTIAVRIGKSRAELPFRTIRRVRLPSLARALGPFLS